MSLVNNLPLAMTLFLWLCLCHTVCVISTQICRFCRNPSERNYTGIWAEKCSLCSAKFPAVPGNLNTQQTVSSKFSVTKEVPKLKLYMSVRKNQSQLDNTAFLSVKIQVLLIFIH